MNRLNALRLRYSKPLSQIILVTIGSRPGASGRKISPVRRRFLKTAPSGAPAPIFFATSIRPSGVARLPGLSTNQCAPVVKLHALVRYTDENSVIPILCYASGKKHRKRQKKENGTPVAHAWIYKQKTLPDPVCKNRVKAAATRNSSIWGGMASVPSHFSPRLGGLRENGTARRPSLPLKANSGETPVKGPQVVVNALHNCCCLEICS